MSNNSYEDSFVTTTDQVKQQNNRFTLSKFEADLFDEDKDKAEPIIRIKRVKLPNNGENWKIFNNNEQIFLIEGVKLTKKEKSFLRSTDGVLFLIEEFKVGVKSFNALKKTIRANLP